MGGNQGRWLRIGGIVAIVAVLVLGAVWLVGREAPGASPSPFPEDGWLEGQPAADLATKPAAEGVPAVEIEGIVQDISGDQVVLMLPDESDVFFVRFTEETDFSPSKDDIPINALVTVHATIRNGTSYADFVRLAE